MKYQRNTLRKLTRTDITDQDKDKSWKQRLVGYEFKHIMKVEFESDNKRLGRILFALANAKAKATVLTQEAGVCLKDIQSIDYSWGEINFEYRSTGGYADEVL